MGRLDWLAVTGNDPGIDVMEPTAPNMTKALSKVLPDGLGDNFHRRLWQLTHT